MVRAGKHSRLVASDWVDTALEAMCDGGLQAIAIEPLARRLGVTKGSFYWHFDDRGALVDAALQQWEEMSATNRFAEIDDSTDAAARLRQLILAMLEDERTMTLDFTVHIAADDPLVAPWARRVDHTWVDWLRRQYLEMDMDSDAAHDRAVMAYAAYIGFLRLIRTDPDLVSGGPRRSTYGHYLARALLPPGFRDGA